MRTALFCLALFFGVSGFVPILATEVDSFTDRDPKLQDASLAVNQIINRYLTSAMEIANKKKSCDPTVISNALLKQFKGAFWTSIEEEIMNDPKIDKRQSPVSESVYQDFCFIEAFALKLASLGGLMRFGELYVGTDKLGHFLQFGYDMFEDIYHGKRFQDAIDWSTWTEISYFGMMSTGVYSYGDLASNYDGIYFWERVTNLGLPHGEAPYFKCVDNKWHRVAHFDIAEYLNEAWDEGINCSTYKSAALDGKVKARISDLEAKTGRSLQCPIIPDRCQKMIERYGNVAEHVITKKCF